jgi:hypothetical protein
MPNDSEDRPGSTEGRASADTHPPLEWGGVSAINIYALTLGIFATLLLTKLASYLTPYKLYFSFTSMLYDDRASFRWEALIIKLTIPCIVGFCLFYLPHRWMVWTRDGSSSFRRIFRYLAREARLTAMAVGFYAALLSAWPFIVYWDVLQRPDLIERRLPFLFVYLLYFIAYSYFTGFGVSLAQLVLRDHLTRNMNASLPQRVAWFEAIRTSFVGLVTSGIATYLASGLSQMAGVPAAGG